MKLQTIDGKITEVDVKVLKCCSFLKDAREDMESPVVLEQVTSKVLAKVIQWLSHHQNDPVESNTTETKDQRNLDISKWDMEFCKVDQQTLFELTLAAHSLGIKPLLDIMCKLIADMIKGKSRDEISKTFNIMNDLSPEMRLQAEKECDGLEK